MTRLFLKGLSLVLCFEKNRRWSSINVENFLHLIKNLRLPIVKRRRRRGNHWGRLLLFGAVFVASGWFVIVTQWQQADAQGSETGLTAPQLSSPSLPAAQVHPLPPTLAQWQDKTGKGDYLAQIKLTPVGYLVWSQFPVKIYVERPTNLSESPASLQQFQQWVEAVLTAVQEWSVYLPLEVVSQREGADILILHERPPLQASFDRETGKFNIPRARSAETRYKFYLRPAANVPNKVLSQRFTIQLSPHQTVEYTLATARHELGHALGIWGHSPLESDTMYFSQVRKPPEISVRDINTLKRIYEQPTRLGWPLPS